MATHLSRDEFVQNIGQHMGFPKRAWDELWAVYVDLNPKWIPLRFLSLHRNYTKYEIVWIPGESERMRREISSWFTPNTDQQELKEIMSKLYPKG